MATGYNVLKVILKVFAKVVITHFLDMFGKCGFTVEKIFFTDGILPWRYRILFSTFDSSWGKSHMLADILNSWWTRADWNLRGVLPKIFTEFSVTLFPPSAGVAWKLIFLAIVLNALYFAGCKRCFLVLSNRELHSRYSARPA